MKHIFFKVVASLVLFCALAFIGSTLTAQNIPDPHGDFDQINRCRCKEVDGEMGCYGGNAISLRPCCAKSKNPINCWEYDRNCKNAGGEGGTTN